MKKNLKLGLVIVLSIVVTIVFAGNVMAADGLWSSNDFETSTNSDVNTNDTWETPSNTVNNEVNNIENTNVTNVITNTNTNTNSEVANVSVNFSSNINNNKTNVTNTMANTDKLAKTGIADLNGGFVIILAIATVIGVYSFKKIKDYENM